MNKKFKIKSIQRNYYGRVVINNCSVFATWSAPLHYKCRICDIYFNSKLQGKDGAQIARMVHYFSPEGYTATANRRNYVCVNCYKKLDLIATFKERDDEA